MLPDVEQCFGEEAEECVVEAVCLHAAALHHRADGPAHQNPVDGLGGRVEEATEQVQETYRDTYGDGHRRTTKTSEKFDLIDIICQTFSTHKETLCLQTETYFDYYIIYKMYYKM